jgi:hypothetical protein
VPLCPLESRLTLSEGLCLAVPMTKLQHTDCGIYRGCQKCNRGEDSWSTVLVVFFVLFFLGISVMAAMGQQEVNHDHQNTITVVVDTPNNNG